LTFAAAIRELDDATRSGGIEAFWALAPDLFSRVLVEKLHVAALNEILAGIRDKNLPITAHHTAGQFVALHTSPHSNWAMIFHRMPPTFLYLSPVDALQARIGGAELTITRYTCEQPKAFDLLQPDLRLTKGESSPAPLGEPFRRHGCREILDWSSEEGNCRAGVTLRVNSGLLAEFEWAFDRETLGPVGISGVDPVRSNLVTIFTLLASVGDPTSIEQLQPFLAGDKHFVRWAAARAIAAIDAAEGIASIRALANDPHSEVRMAARHALDQMASAA
jgi:hypothetical protein